MNSSSEVELQAAGSVQQVIQAIEKIRRRLDHLSCLSQRIFCKHILPDRYPLYQMLLYNLLQYLRCTGVIPDSIGTDHRYRPSHTDPTALTLGAQHPLMLPNSKLFKRSAEHTPAIQ